MRSCLASVLTLAVSFGSVASAQQEPPAADPVEKALDEQTLTVNFAGTPLEEFVNFMRDITPLNWVLDPAAPADHAVTLQLQNVPLREVLAQALAGSGTEARVFCGAVVLVPAGKDLGQPPVAGADAAGKALNGRKVTLNFPATPMEEVLSFVRDITKLEVEVAPAARRRVETTSVSLRVRDLPLASALALATHPWGLTWRTTEGGKVLLELLPAPPPGPPANRKELDERLGVRTSLEAEDKNLHAVCATLEASTGITFKVEGVSPAIATSVSLLDIPLRELLDVLGRMYGAQWAVEGRTVVFRPRAR